MSDVRPAGPRTTILATLPDGRHFEAPSGTPVGEILAAARKVDRGAEAPPPLAGRGAEAPPPQAPEIVAAIINGRLRELTTRVTADVEMRPVTLTDADGMRIYRRSLAFLLITAAGEVFPDASLYIEHSAPTLGAYYCRMRGRASFTARELEQVEARMRAIVAADERITKVPASREQAIALFEARGEPDKARLLAHRSHDGVVLYELRGRRDYLQGYMVPSTRCLERFRLLPHPPGFVLQYPHQASPNEITPFEPYPRLFATFTEAGEWLDKLGIRGTGALNDAIVDNRLPEVSLVAEALHEARIAAIASEIISRGEELRVVLIAGPSSSGKTTFSKRLAVQLLAGGLRPFAVALDDYFVDRDRTPRDENGELDFEALGAIDVPLINEHLLSLMNGHPTSLPRYSFMTGSRETGPTVTLGPRDVVIIEGIHGLNPKLVPALPRSAVYRIYVSAITQLNLDRHNRVSISDTRLVRRIVRDAATRGYRAAQTLGRWESVQRGERLHIFPFTENSDAIFNSSLVHELSVLRPFAEPLLLQVRPDTPEYREASRVLSFLQWFRPASPQAVPDNSILREFIGGSILENFQWGRTE